MNLQAQSHERTKGQSEEQLLTETKSLYEKKKDRNTDKEEKGTWRFENTEKDFCCLQERKRAAWYLQYLKAQISSSFKSLNFYFPLLVQPARCRWQSSVQKPVLQTEKSAVDAGQYLSFSLVFALKPWLKVMLVSHYIKPEGKAGETPDIFNNYTTCQSMPVCLYPATECECQAHLKMTMLQAQVQPEAIQPGMQW